MPIAKANGIAIAYECLGAAAAEPVLLIAGLGVQMIRWTLPFCEILAAQGFRVIRLDNRDVGLSTHLDGAPIPDIARVAERRHARRAARRALHPPGHGRRRHGASRCALRSSARMSSDGRWAA